MDHFSILAEVMAPMINSATRISETSAIVSFTVPPSEQDAEYFEVLLYTADNGKRFNEVHMLILVSCTFVIPLLYNPVSLEQHGSYK